MSICPSCRQDAVTVHEPGCLTEDGEVMYVSVCANCDYGINLHTEGECGCA